MIARTQGTGTVLQVHADAGGMPGNKEGASVMVSGTAEAIDGRDRTTASLDSDEAETSVVAVLEGVREYIKES